MKCALSRYKFMTRLTDPLTSTRIWRPEAQVMSLARNMFARTPGRSHYLQFQKDLERLLSSPYRASQSMCHGDQGVGTL
jgi:hypothetical protein